ncbi:MAG: ABC transporter ATP-binding protein [Candidatus Riflebacteria bacterium]|jgi:putative ABC transport system ATP-binding protein|nr:ABC transporter ATP-binding protein [Candidatus Riflebacteria bacterium]NCB45968.1 ABC transporter ATP-binding protein [bacterium]NLV93445.1 ABC transporter ATP-binding protein [Candidatus Riflebacteria bacterium]
MFVLNVENLSKSFDVRGNQLKIFSDISFAVKPGEVLLISGRSGVGKSTLLGILSGLDRANSGKIFFKDKDLTAMTLNELAELRAKHIGMIFQSFNLIQTWTALENVEAVLMHRGIDAAERRKRATEILEELGLGERLANLPAELSVGQQQRVAIARTMVHRPDLILADEPTGDVDEETASEIMTLLMERVKKDKISMIAASHGAFNKKYADRELLLKDGKICDITETI